jgi:hypothetical protein
MQLQIRIYRVDVEHDELSRCDNLKSLSYLLINVLNIFIWSIECQLRQVRPETWSYSFRLDEYLKKNNEKGKRQISITIKRTIYKCNVKEIMLIFPTFLPFVFRFCLSLFFFTFCYFHSLNFDFVRKCLPFSFLARQLCMSCILLPDASVYIWEVGGVAVV